MKSKNIKRLENYPDILSLEDVRSILDVRTKYVISPFEQIGKLVITAFE